MYVPPIPVPHLDYKGCPVIKLFGFEFFIPLLAVRQTRIIIPALGRLLPALDRIRADPTALSEADYDLMLLVIHTALTRAYPKLELDSLLDEQLSLHDMTQAIPIIVQQTQLFKAAPPASGDAAAPVPEDAAA